MAVLARRTTRLGPPQNTRMAGWSTFFTLEPPVPGPEVHVAHTKPYPIQNPTASLPNLHPIISIPINPSLPLSVHPQVPTRIWQGLCVQDKEESCWCRRLVDSPPQAYRDKYARWREEHVAAFDRCGFPTCFLCVAGAPVVCGLTFLGLTMQLPICRPLGMCAMKDLVTCTA